MICPVSKGTGTFQFQESEIRVSEDSPLVVVTIENTGDTTVSTTVR